MNTKLITALRTTASALENETFDYKWDSGPRCNCGSLFCTLTGKSSAELLEVTPKAFSGNRRNWKVLVGQHCPITGMPTQELFAELFGYGLSQKDIIDLENLSNPQILAAMPKRRFWQFGPRYNNKKDVILYMRAWANILTEEGQMDSPEPQKSTRSHAKVSI